MSEKKAMKGMNFRLPAKIHIRMRGHDTVNWSAMVRDLLTNKLDELDKGEWRSTKGERDE
jgi:hypothetical protein